MMKKINNSGFTHLDSTGQVKMVDVGGKPVQRREARASGKIILERDTIKLIAGNRIEKGSVLTIAKVAGIMAAKRTGKRREKTESRAIPSATTAEMAKR